MIGRIALRLATIAALMGRTRVGDNVLDSEITALDADERGNLTTDQQRPFIAVYTNNSEVSEFSGRELHQAGITELVIETAIAATMAERGESDEVEVAAGIPATDAAFEFILDIIGRQIVNALTDPESEWAGIWRSLAGSILKIERKRAADASGARIAAHQLVITVRLLSDPVFGEPVAPTSTWARFFEKLAEPAVANPAHDPDDPDSGPAMIVDPLIAASALMMLELIGDPGGALSIEAGMRRFGLTREEAEALQLGAEPQPASDGGLSVTHEL